MALYPESPIRLDHVENRRNEPEAGISDILRERAVTDMLDKDGIMDMVLEYGHRRAEAAEVFEMGRRAHTVADQAIFRDTAERLTKAADEYFQRIQRELGE